MEINNVYTVVSAVLGLITAIINRKQIVELKYSSRGSSSNVTIAKRFKRIIMLLVVGFIAMMIVALLKAEVSTGGVVLGFFIILILYQFLAILILMWTALWR